MVKKVLSRRRFCTVIGGIAGVSALALSCSAGERATPTSSTQPMVPNRPTVLPGVAASPVKGDLVIVQEGNLASFDLGTLQSRALTNFPKGAYVSSPVLSRDGKRLSYTYFVAPTDPNDLGGSDLYLADVTGANPTVLHKHPSAGATFEDPCWTADGQAVLATLRQGTYNNHQYQGESLTIVRAKVDGSPLTVLVKAGMGPGASPDGNYLAYTGIDSQSNPSGFYIADADGKVAVQILGDQGFNLIRFPVFSPDSSRIVFSAIGGPGAAIPGIKVGWLPPGFGVAEADGPPWDLWSVRPDGTDLQRLTRVAEDTPIPTWSPDGAWIAFAGSYGLYVVDAAGKKATCVSSVTSGGGVAWPAGPPQTPQPAK